MRNRQLRDALGLVAVQGDQLDHELCHRVCNQLGVADLAALLSES